MHIYIYIYIYKYKYIHINIYIYVYIYAEQLRRTTRPLRYLTPPPSTKHPKPQTPNSKNLL